MIRVARGAELRLVQDLAVRVWRATYAPLASAEYAEMGIAKWWNDDEVTRGIRTGRLLVAELDGELVGLVKLSPLGDQMVMWALLVDPVHQHAGVGSALLAEATRRCAERYDELWTNHIAPNDRAHAFLTRSGFEVRRVDPGSDIIPDLVWMSRPVSKEMP